MIENTFFRVTRPMGYLLNALRKRFITSPKFKHRAKLLTEHVPEVQALHIHQKMVNHQEVSYADRHRDNPIQNILPHHLLLIRSIKDTKIHTLSGPELAGALNAGKPIEKPQTHRASDVENHLADFNHQITVRCCRRHLASPSMLEIVSEVCEFLDTPKPVCYSKFLSWRP